jgi:hypothetical protein
MRSTVGKTEKCNNLLLIFSEETGQVSLLRVRARFVVGFAEALSGVRAIAKLFHETWADGS